MNLDRGDGLCTHCAKLQRGTHYHPGILAVQPQYCRPASAALDVSDFQVFFFFSIGASELEQDWSNFSSETKPVDRNIPVNFEPDNNVTLLYLSISGYSRT